MASFDIVHHSERGRVWGRPERLWATSPGLFWHLLWVWRAESYLVLPPSRPEKAEQAKVLLTQNLGEDSDCSRKGGRREEEGESASPILPTVRASSSDDPVHRRSTAAAGSNPEGNKPQA